MFVGFNLQLSFEQVEQYINYGEGVFKHNPKDIHDELDQYLFFNDTLSADDMMNDCFPTVKANAFISHSHKDVKLAYGLAVFLT